ncbi:MAG: hypothetical protein IJ197_06545 [Bacteroidaceae bacterium]|nr:hypothetical protein [Bacteroidaceae bacterium]
MSFEESRFGNQYEPTKKKRTMTKEDVQLVIHEYLCRHRDYFEYPRLERVESFNVFMSAPFNGIGTYQIHGDATIWVKVNENNGEHMTIATTFANCSVTIGANVDGEPVVINMDKKIILYKK